MLPRKPVLATPQPTRRGGRLRALLLTAAMLLGLAVCATTSAGPAGASVPSRTKLERSIGRTIHEMINQERAAHGLSPVRMSPKLQLAARRHNVHMARHNEMSHQLPGEPYFGQRILNAGYHWSYAGENIAWNSVMTRSGVQLLERLMYNEKAPYNDHRLNILSRHYKAVGVDVYMDKAHHKIWLTTDFGHHRWG